MTSSLEARLQYLESREDANAKDIRKLKTENVELQSKVCDLRRENLQTSEKLLEMEARCKKMEYDLKDVIGFRDIIDNRLTNMESNVGLLQDNHDRVCKLESDMNLTRQEITHHCQSVTDKLDNLHLEGHSIDQEAGAEGETPVKTLMVDVSNPPKQDEISVGLVPNVNDKMEHLEKQADKLQSRIDVLEGIRDQIAQSVTYADLNSRQRMETGKVVKLDQFFSQYDTRYGCFNADSCCYEPPITGHYLVNVHFCQFNGGKIDIWAKSDSNVLPVGRTSESNGECSTLLFLRLFKGQNLRLEAERVEGNAYIGWCNMACWLLSPLSDAVCTRS